MVYLLSLDSGKLLIYTRCYQSWYKCYIMFDQLLISTSLLQHAALLQQFVLYYNTAPVLYIPASTAHTTPCSIHTPPSTTPTTPSTASTLLPNYPDTTLPTMHYAINYPSINNKGLCNNYPTSRVNLITNV